MRRKKTPSPPSADSFIVPASNTKGQSSRQWFRTQPGHDRQLEELLASRQFPYRTKGDILRHALHRHIEWLRTQRPVPSVTREVDAILALMRTEYYLQDFKAVFDGLSNLVDTMAHDPRDANHARKVVIEVRDRIREMPEGYWRDRYAKEFNRKYAGLLQGAKLIPVDEGAGPGPKPKRAKKRIGRKSE